MGEREAQIRALRAKFSEAISNRGPALAGGGGIVWAVNAILFLLTERVEMQAFVTSEIDFSEKRAGRY